ncbi:MAG: hydroxyacylglutathione hydrolase [Sulfitobacter sp.]
MPLKIITIPCLDDNYAFLINDEATGTTALIDAPDAAPILAELRKQDWDLDQIWLTHHHNDHIDGVAELLASHTATVTGARADTHRLPPLDQSVADGDRFTFAGHDVQILDVSGHTVGHIAFYVPDAGAVFTADSLMALGCGRLFEGTPAQMWQSLQKLMALPQDTLVCSGHEYTSANAKFALTIDPDNPALISRSGEIDAARAANRPTVPSILRHELDTNPFLRASNPDIRARLGMTTASDAEVFKEIRARKDAF